MRTPTVRTVRTVCSPCRKPRRSLGETAVLLCYDVSGRNIISLTFLPPPRPALPPTRRARASFLRTSTVRPRFTQVEKHEPLWAKHVFLKEASWSDHWSVMRRARIAMAFDSRAEVSKSDARYGRETPSMTEVELFC